MARRMCDVCGARPATVAIRRIVPGGGQRIEHLCEVHAAQARGGRSSFGSGGLFDDFFNQFFETPTGGPRRVPIGEEATGRRATHRLPGPHRGLQERRPDHDLQLGK